MNLDTFKRDFILGDLKEVFNAMCILDKNGGRKCAHTWLCLERQPQMQCRRRICISKQRITRNVKLPRPRIHSQMRNFVMKFSRILSARQIFLLLFITMSYYMYRDGDSYVLGMSTPHYIFWNKTYEYTCKTADKMRRLAIPHDKTILYPDIPSNIRPTLFLGVECTYDDCIQYNNKHHMGLIRELDLYWRFIDL